MSRRIPNVLTIAGSDPSGGAGIQADLRTFAALGVYGCSALTALTSQNTLEVTAIHLVPPPFLRQQLDAVFTDVRIDAVKIGMTGSAETIEVIADALRVYRPPFVVLDPVLRASTGAALLDSAALRVLLSELLPLVTVVTPNTYEVGMLLGIDAPDSVSAARAAARALTGRRARAVLVTGGHLADPTVSVDVLDDGSDVQESSVSRVPGTGTHGTGCTLTSAIAAFLALGSELPRACRDAQGFVARAIMHAPELTVGRGTGPVHQLGTTWNRHQDDAAV
jgi:hydroxymethylpyrimidine/phosphomethylpyrimidine kinase